MRKSISSIINEEIGRFKKRVMREEIQPNYSVEWEFHKNKSGTDDDLARGWRRASTSNDSGFETFYNEDEAYQFFLEKLENHAGDYAVKFKFCKDGKTIEDLSGTRLFSGRVKGNETFDWQWSKDQKERPSDEDPTPYGSYRDEKGNLKTPRQEPITEAMGQDFSFATLSRLSSLQDMIAYCNKHLGEPDGEGSTRVVYQLSDKLCLKLAKDELGVAQNKNEYERSNPGFEILTKVYGHDSKYRFLVSEYALPAIDEDIEKIAKVTPFQFFYIVNILINWRNGKLASDDELNTVSTLINDGPNVYWQLYDYISKSKENTNDIGLVDNLGIVNRYGDAQLVILDSGYDEEIFQKQWGNK